MPEFTYFPKACSTILLQAKRPRIERDVFERLPSGSLAAFAGRFRFIDIGTPKSLARAANVFGAVPRG